MASLCCYVCEPQCKWTICLQLECPEGLGFSFLEPLLGDSDGLLHLRGCFSRFRCGSIRCIGFFGSGRARSELFIASRRWAAQIDAGRPMNQVKKVAMAVCVDSTISRVPFLYGSGNKQLRCLHCEVRVCVFPTDSRCSNAFSSQERFDASVCKQQSRLFWPSG